MKVDMDELCENCGHSRAVHVLGMIDDKMLPKWCDDAEGSLKFAPVLEDEA